MVLTPSTMVTLGSPLPDFELPDVVTGKIISNASFNSMLKNPQMQGATKRPRRRTGRYVAQGSAEATPQMRVFQHTGGLLVMFICRHCPYVQHIQNELAKLGRDYQKSPLGILAISSNDAKNYPDDAPNRLKEMADELGFSFPYAYDENQEVARKFKAACTPDFFLYDSNFRLVYRGQLDDSRPGNGKPVTGKDLREAMDAVMAGKSVDKNQRPSIGCNIKWK